MTGRTGIRSESAFVVVVESEFVLTLFSGYPDGQTMNGVDGYSNNGNPMHHGREVTYSAPPSTNY